ncbi:hypothetical protein GCM10009742_11260 [Kribbella karoonensis]|uniref:Uncharacterized protein n=1 Tax=Kribbella karoonensis TaxID=324851 RepID=A0ABP4P5B2_9ACTN
MRRPHRPAAAVELLDDRDLDLGAVSQVRVTVGTPEALAGELGFAAFAQCTQRDPSSLEQLRCGAIGIRLGTFLEFTQLVAELWVQDEVVLRCHRAWGGWSLSRFHPNSAASSSADT